MSELRWKALDLGLHRVVNERIDGIALTFGADAEIEYICECGAASCRAWAHNTFAAYAAVATNGIAERS